MRVWIYEKLIKPITDNFRKEISDDEVGILRSAVRDGDNLSRMLDTDGWNVFTKRYAESLLFDLSMLSDQLRSGKSDNLHLQFARLLGKAEGLEDIRQILRDAQAAETKIAEIEKQKKMNFETNEILA